MSRFPPVPFTDDFSAADFLRLLHLDEEWQRYASNKPTIVCQRCKALLAIIPLTYGNGRQQAEYIVVRGRAVYDVTKQAHICPPKVTKRTRSVREMLDASGRDPETLRQLLGASLGPLYASGGELLDTSTHTRLVPPVRLLCPNKRCYRIRSLTEIPSHRPFIYAAELTQLQSKMAAWLEAGLEAKRTDWQRQLEARRKELGLQIGGQYS